MKKFLLSMTMMSFIATQTQAVRMTDLELLEELYPAQPSRRAASQESKFDNDRDSAQLLRNITESASAGMFVIPVVVLLLTSGHAQKSGMSIVMRSRLIPSNIFPAVAGRPHSITGIDMPTSWEDMEKIWHNTFGKDDQRDLQDEEPNIRILHLRDDRRDNLAGEDALKAIKAAERGLAQERRDTKKRLRRAMDQQTKSHSRQLQNHKTHKGSRLAGQSMRQLRSMNGR